ncbi:uncharacterized protein [Lepeophtheirus salmonis]|uniref:Uncharacterized protein n=1 Tax=Lepeophtheirus salmonis TaxID=72036 RepID=A0A0K2TS72_LEPSM|nr:uncharacterized protein LOC121125306 [Lepeophtheirus salmonis]
MATTMKLICLFALIGCVMGGRNLRPIRGQRSLLNTFPFNSGERGTAASEDHEHVHEHLAHEEHGHAHDESQEFEASENRLARQGGDDVPLDIGSIAAAGERCIDKVVVVEETEYDDHIECHHSYSERCHTTYTTDFEPQQEEKCEENFKKSCFIEYKKVAIDETIKFCHTPFICEGEGPEECKTVYESECTTRYHEHDVEDDVVNCETIQEEKCEDVTQGYTTEQKCTKWPRQVCTSEKKNVLKYSPQTECKKVPRELCGPSGCVLQPGPEECFDKKETIVQEVPEENCNLEPQKSCKQVTKLVPSLKPVEECVDVPKEVCSRSRKNPRKVQKPVVKKWCYVPSAASGLA